MSIQRFHWVQGDLLPFKYIYKIATRLVLLVNKLAIFHIRNEATLVLTQRHFLSNSNNAGCFVPFVLKIETVEKD